MNFYPSEVLQLSNMSHHMTSPWPQKKKTITGRPFEDDRLDTESPEKLCIFIAVSACIFFSFSICR